MTGEKEKITGVISRSEEEFIENMHDATLGNDPFKALQARCLKRLGPPIMRWLQDERDRRTDPQEVVEATSIIALNILMSIAVSVAKKGRQDETVKKMIFYMLGAYTKVRQEGLLE